ncbi:MAG: alpha/beta hydrolase [Anaerostipes sp.]|nr:alpha/beta hydrolase [Anaerostipes sp.]
MQKRSVRGRLISNLIEDIASTSVGEKFYTGEVYQQVKEPKWICPRGYKKEEINREQYKMELLSPRLRPNNIVVLQLHGGGYIGGLRNAHRRFALQYSKRCFGGSVLTPDYRVAPEHVFPAALEDAVDAYQWLLNEKEVKPEHIIVAGDSAGGGLALGLGLYLKDHEIPLPGGFILMSPWTDLTLSGESLTLNYDKDPLFGGTKHNMIYEAPYPGEHDRKDPYLSPFFGHFYGFPPMLFQVGGNEVLLDDTRRVAKKAKKSGVKVRCSVYPEMFHVFQMGLGLLPESRAAWNEIGEFLKRVVFTNV